MRHRHHYYFYIIICFSLALKCHGINVTGYMPNGIANANLGTSTDSQVTISSTSRIQCAAACNQKQCSMFTFQDGVCVMHSVGSEAVHDDALYILTSKEISTVNVATQKPSYGSQSVDGVKENVLDDDPITCYSGSNPAGAPWFMVDLGAAYDIAGVEVWPHPNYYSTYFLNIAVKVGTQLETDGIFASYSNFYNYPGPPPTADSLAWLHAGGGINGQYVAIMSESQSYIDLCEFKVITA